MEYAKNEFFNLILLLQPKGEKMYLIIITLALIVLDIFNIPSHIKFFTHLDFHSFPALITGMIVFSAMIFIDEENKKRWEKDYFQKFQNEQILELIKLLNKFIQNTRGRESDHIQALVANYEMLFLQSLNVKEIELLKDLNMEVNYTKQGPASEYEKEHNLQKVKTIKDKLSKIVFV